MPKWIDRWAGGRFYKNGRTGRLVYVIEKKHGSHRYSIPLDAGNEQEALAQLALFRDPKQGGPEGFKRRMEAAAATEPIASDGFAVTQESVQALVNYLRLERKENRKHVASVAHYLEEWGKAGLNGRPLRTIKGAELYRILDGWKTARRLRVAALKAFCTWAVRKCHIEPTENPSLVLRVEKSEPEKSHRAKAYTIEEVEAHYRHVADQRHRDVLCLRAKTGMHHSEIERIASGDCELREVKDRTSPIRGVAVFKHKSGYTHAQAFDTQAFAAAKRMRASGAAPTKDGLLKATMYAAKRLGAETKKPIDYLRPSHLRHSFVTWATGVGKKVTVTGRGVDLQEVSRIVGHRSPLMTGDHYDHSIPPMIELPLRLFHPDDPIPLERSADVEASA